MARITLDHIRHAYNAKAQAAGDYALKEVHHEWEDGGAYALLGPSGCGKTTLLNIISGLLRPSEGRIAFDGTDVTDFATEDRNIAQVFQFPVVYDTMTVYDNLAFPLRNRQVPEAEVDRRVREILEMTDLSGMAKRHARGLTADQKQKISLARGLVRSDVNAILFDEPLTVIDPHMKWVLRSQLKRLHRQSGFTMVYVTHDQTEALTFADKVVVMYDGQIVQIGTPAELFERPGHTFVGYFIGSPGMNVLPANIEGRQLWSAVLVCRWQVRRRSMERNASRSVSARNSSGWSAAACRSLSTRLRISAGRRSSAPGLPARSWQSLSPKTRKFRRKRVSVSTRLRSAFLLIPGA